MDIRSERSIKEKKNVDSPLLEYFKSLIVTEPSPLVRETAQEFC